MTSITPTLDWCSFYNFVRNSLVALLETLCAWPPAVRRICGNSVSFHFFLLYLRYLSDASQVQTLQASLNRSLSTTLHVYGHPTALLAETGIPPLYITQNMQLAQLRFRLLSSPPATIQHFLWQLWQPLLKIVPFYILETRMQTAVCHVDTVTLLPLCLKMWMWPNPLTKRSHTRNILSPNALIGGENISCLNSVTHQGECEHKYTGISLTNTNAACISQPHSSPTHPAPTNSNSNRTHIIPFHLHYAFRNPRADYQDRVCPHCLVTGTTVLWDELHIICHCPATKGVLEQFTAKFQGLTRLLDLAPFATFKPDEMTRMVHRTPPLGRGTPRTQVLKKGLKGWITEATPLCCSAHACHLPTSSRCRLVLWWWCCNVVRWQGLVLIYIPSS